VLLFSWLDPLVWRAHRVEHIPLEKLPPLPDVDQARILTREAFPKIDPMDNGKPKEKHRHIFWGLVWTYRKTFTFITVTAFLQIVSTLLSPYAFFLLLQYIATQGEGAEVRPWTWVALIFVSRLVTSVVAQQYYKLPQCIPG
jgi:ABC-type bacteriocin/lantibiotic exporter with double-glycine peptidase domain